MKKLKYWTSMWRRAHTWSSGQEAQLLDVRLEVELPAGVVERLDPPRILLGVKVVLVDSLREHPGLKGVDQLCARDVTPDEDEILSEHEQLEGADGW